MIRQAGINDPVPEQGAFIRWHNKGYNWKLVKNWNFFNFWGELKKNVDPDSDNK